MKNITSQINAKITVTQFANNCFTIETKFGIMLRHYDSNIAFIPNDEPKIYLGKDYKYSVTTAKFRNKFLGMDSKELEEAIKKGQAIIKKDL